MQQTVVIFGGRGNLGVELVRAFTLAGYAVISVSREMCDITNPERVASLLAEHAPHIVMNAASYNAVDLAEGDGRGTAMRVNGDAPGILAQEAKKIGARFVHFSSDYVFSGDDRETYHEDADPSPVNAYGTTKLLGERAVRAQYPEGAFIVRTSKLFGPVGMSSDCKPSFVTIMTKLALTVPELTLVDDEHGCPTFTRDLAEAVLALLRDAYAPGVYHLVNEDAEVTWHGFAEEIFSVLGIDPVRKTTDGATFVRAAKRPSRVVLQNTRGPKLPSRRDALERFLHGSLKSSMDIRLTGIPGLFVFTTKRLGDERGWFSEALSFARLRDLGLAHIPVQINEGQSLKGIVRGLHFQAPPFAQTKIVTCTAGRIFDVAVDIRKTSPTYGKWFGIELSAQNGTALYIPEGFAHGMMALEDGSRIRYHVFGAPWEKAAEGGLRFDDPDLGIAWPELDVAPMVNARDQSWPLFEHFTSPW